MDQSKIVCEGNSCRILETLQSLGFTINRKKSVLVPCQRIVFFGHVIDTVCFKVFLTDEKVEKIIKKAGSILECELVVVRELASFIGLIVSSFNAILEAPLHYRELERDKICGLGSDMNFDNKTVLSILGRQEVIWWFNNVKLKNGKRIRPVTVSRHCRTDASFEGYGGIDIDNNIHCNGRWSLRELNNSINYLELLAIFYSLQAMFAECKDLHIQVQSDNTTAIAYINNFGGMESRDLDNLSKLIWKWCLDRNVYISAVHVPGRLNSADFYSRNFSDSTEWMLKDDIFQRLCKHTFIPDVDLFASRLNKRLPRFVSWFPEPGALAVNAFAISWSNFTPYIFPPFNLIGKVINKIITDEVDKALVVIPYWFTQSWFPLLLDILSDFPISIPRHTDLLVLPHDGQKHPLSKRMKMVGVVLSGKRSKIQDFRKKLQVSYLTHGLKVHVNSTQVLGVSGVFGIISEVPIHFVPLQ
ncbi:uncharacterized protein LOC132749435 [Ruditapes philippinarum]|uniref:uncharacterized protein LOC132749435 n=1 Tax=Ruditapes philippinarum TaxID=129788 RepID=UPI00295B0E2E|nr:uncharacterized protein LOC132749435 [Ruditapes philippinarum]